MQFDESLVVAASFVVFVVLAAKPIARLLAGGLDTRSAAIKKELDQAMALKEEAQALLASYQRRQKKALEDAEDIIANAKEEAQRIVSTTRKKVEEELGKRTELAMQKITQAEATAIQGIRENAVDLTVSAARQLILENMSPESAESLVEKTISDLNRKFH